MGTPDVPVLQEQLLERRQRLEAASVEVEEPQHLMQLLEEVDAALERMRTGSCGLCMAALADTAIHRRRNTVRSF